LGPKLINIRFVIKFNVSVAVLDKYLTFIWTSFATHPLFSRYKLLRAKKN